MLGDLHTHLSDTLSGETWSGVEIAEDIDVLGEMAGQVPDATLILMPWGESAEENSRATGDVLQRVHYHFATGIVLRDFSDRTGAERATRIDQLKGDIEAALLGHELPGFDMPCELIGGESSPISRGVSIFVQTWATARSLTGET